MTSFQTGEPGASTEPEQIHMYVDGEWDEGDGSETYVTSNPATGAPLAELPKGVRSDVDRAIRSANRVRSELERMTAFDRAELCYEIADAVEREREHLERWIVADQGKPVHEARYEVVDTFETFRNMGEYVKHATTEVLPSRDPNKQVITIRKPRGVYGIITPWNYPVGNPAEHIAAALAGGNSVVWASAPTTSAVASKLVEIIDETSIPDGALNHVIGDGPVVGDEIVVNDGVDAIGFTGSTATGTEIARRAGLKHLLLELGGNGPVIVLEDAAIEAAIEGTALSCFYNAGQVCTSSERILVHESRQKEFTDGLIEWAENIDVGDPFDEETDMGPLNNDSVLEKVNQHIEDAVEKGATVRYGGETIEDAPSDRFFMPTVIDGVTDEMLLSREETFGPVAPISTFETHEEAIEIANQDDYGLTSAVFTSNVNAMGRFTEDIESGTVIVNDGSSYWEAQLPMGGYSGSKSGIGRRGGKFTVDEMTQMKTIIVDTENAAKSRFFE